MTTTRKTMTGDDMAHEAELRENAATPTTEPVRCEVCGAAIPYTVDSLSDLLADAAEGTPLRCSACARQP